MSTILDRAIGWFAPSAGLRRARSRAALELLSRSFDGARLGRRTEHWVTSGSSANAELGPALTRLRDRSRDLVRNNPYAAKGVHAVVGNLIGVGINPRSSSGDTALDKTVDGLWRSFSRQCDADGLTDFTGLQALIARSMVESGECLIRFRQRRLADRLAVPLQLQVIEPDLLDVTKSVDLGGGAFILQGIEFDPLGRRRGYWLLPGHPGETLPTMRFLGESRRVDAADVLHLFDRLRPGQVRGIPWFAPVILKLRDLDDYDEAEIYRKKIEACFAAFVTDSDERTLGTPKTEDSRRIEEFEPGMIEYLGPGQDVRFATPGATGGYGEYMRVQLHAIAAGVGLTYELLTGDLSQVNYSSIRAGLIEFRRRIEALQWQLVVPALCVPVWDRFVATSQALGLLPLGEIPVEWTPPRFEAVDPAKDIKADVLAVRAGFMTLKDAIARQGYAPVAQLTEIAETNAMLDKLGIVLDSDPRQATQAGNPVAAIAQEKPNADDEDEDEDDEDEDNAAAA